MGQTDVANAILSSMADLARLRRIDLRPDWADAAKGLDRDDEEAIGTYCEAIGWAPPTAYADNPRAHEFPLLVFHPAHGWGVAEQVENNGGLRVVKNGINTIWNDAGDARLYDLVVPLPAGQKKFERAFDVFKEAVFRRKHVLIIAIVATFVVNIIALGTFAGDDPSTSELVFKVSGPDEATLKAVLEPLSLEVRDIRTC